MEIYRAADDLKCYLCENTAFIKRPGSVRDNPQLDVLECRNCGLVFLSSFSHIHESFYEESGMHKGEINFEKWLKETAVDDERRFNYLKNSIVNQSLLDFGCGNGGFLMRAKNVAKSIKGVELESAARMHMSESYGIEAYSHVDEIDEKYDYITLFHVLEHIEDPIVYLKKLSCKLNQRGQIIIEVPNSQDALLKTFECDAFTNFTYWSCHLYLYSTATLSALAQKANLKVNYIKQIQRYPISNHLFWLSKGKPGGHKVWSFLDDELMHAYYESKLASIGCCDTILASLSNDKEL